MTKILASILVLIALILSPYKLFKYGYFHPDKISFYNINITKTTSMKLEWLFIDLTPVSVFYPYIGFNKNVLEFLIRKHNYGEVRISFKDSNGYYIRYKLTVNTKENFNDHQAPEVIELENNNKESSIYLSTTKNTQINSLSCIKLHSNLQKIEDKNKSVYKLYLTLKGQYNFLVISSDKLEYINNATKTISCQQ